MPDLDRRAFLMNASLAAASTALAVGCAAPTAGSKPLPRRFTLDLTPGAIGVSGAPLEMIRLAHAHGFESVQPDAWALEKLDDAGRTAVLAALQAVPLRWGSAGLPVEFRKDEDTFRAELQRLPAVARSLQMVQAQRVGTWLMPASNDLEYHANLQLHARRLREIASILQDHGLRFGLEYVGTPSLRARSRHPFVHSLPQALELIDAIGVRNTGVILDSWHWWTAGDTLEGLAKLTKADVVAVDLNDAPAGLPLDQQQDNRRELPAATGVIPVAGFLNALLAMGYDGPVRAEPFNQPLNALENDEACARTIAALRQAVALAGPAPRAARNHRPPLHAPATMPELPVYSRLAAAQEALGEDAVRQAVADCCQASAFAGRKVLLIVPDHTRTAPVGLLFKALHEHLAGTVRALDVMIALGTHQPLSESSICQRLEITDAERASTYRGVRLLNHEWDNPDALRLIGTLPSSEIAELTAGRFAMDVPVRVNRHLYDYDHLVIVGPVFPHEVVGFSGGYKYLFPGVSGPEVLNFFHWLGAVVTNPMIIGNQWTPVRRVVDRAGAMVDLPKSCFCMVVRPDKSLAGLHAGTPEAAWTAASEQSKGIHIAYKDRAFHSILSCAPTMYDELWTGGKCMYKLEPVLADGGELIIYAPHIREVCITHGRTLHEVGYHCRDYFLAQWDRFKQYPWGVLAHSCHVHGLGTYENGVETPRARVVLATGIPPEVCRRINLGYRDPASIRPDDYRNREHEGVLHVPRAGETLYHLKQKPAWAGGS